MRQYELRCKTSFERGAARFNKQAHEKIKGAGSARRGAWSKSGGGAVDLGAEREETCGRGDGEVGDLAELRPTVVVTAGSETLRQLPAVVTAASLRVPETLAELPVVAASLMALKTLVELVRTNGNGSSRIWMLRIFERVGGSFRCVPLA